MGPKILTVDDDQTIHKCAAASLQTFAYEVLQAADGLDGLTTAQRESPDLILLEFIMPVMDGSAVNDVSAHLHNKLLFGGSAGAAQ